MRRRAAESETTIVGTRTAMPSNLFFNPFTTSHVADLLGLRRKGRLTAGADADLLLLTPAGVVDRVYSRGRLMVEGGTPIVRGPFDGHAAA